MSGSGGSNIDIMIATENLIRHVKAWIVDCSCTTNDHNLIVMELEGNNKIRRNWILAITSRRQTSRNLVALQNKTLMMKF